MRVHPLSGEAKVAAKRADILNKIPAKWGLSPIDLARAEKQRDFTGPFIQQPLHDDDVLIIYKDSVQVVEGMKEGKLTAIQVTTAFCKITALAHHINNCLHEIFSDQTLERAAWLDAQFRGKKSIIGPLHGLPISLKEQFHVRGVDITMSYIGWIDSNLGITDPKQPISSRVKLSLSFLSLGAVLYSKTSLPQTLLFGENKNNLIDETLNPHNRSLLCGGSSGGEGASQALRGSTLGLGTDIGGSVCIPTAFDGIFSLKPTPERLSYRCVANTNPVEITYRSTVGILSTCLGGSGLLLRADLSTKPWLRDPMVVPLPLREEVVNEYKARVNHGGTANDTALPLKLGVLWTDGAVQPHPPITRGLHIVVDAIQSAGHKVGHHPPSIIIGNPRNKPKIANHSELVDWNMLFQVVGRNIYLAFLMADGAHDVHNQLDPSGEPPIPDLEASFRLGDPISILTYQDLTLQGLQYETAYSDYWNSTAEQDGESRPLDSHSRIIDPVIMPVAPHAAVIPGNYYHTAYTEVINLLDYGAVVILVTKADEHTDTVDISYRPSSELDRTNREAYDPVIYDDGPVGPQTVPRKFEEEKILSIAEIIVSATKIAAAESVWFLVASQIGCAKKLL